MTSNADPPEEDDSTLDSLLEESTMTGSYAQPMPARWQRAVDEAAAAAVRGMPTQLRPGERLGRWTLVGLIGRGGAAEVWIAYRERHRGGREVVAIKAILPHLARDKGFARGFLDEARLLSEMQHPNVVRILDVGAERGLPYVALEYITGDSLAALMASADAGGELVPLAIALRVVGEACLGLHMAHELRDELGRPLGVVHRDVSPPNVMLSGDGEVKLIDFGMAKAIDRLADQTRTGVLKGKVDYMSPEQALGTPLDRRSDVWSLSVVLYELVAGRMPYSGGMLDIFSALKRGDLPDPLPGDTPAPVRELLSKALEPRLDARLQSAAELRRGIQYAFAKCCEPIGKADMAAFIRRHLGETLAERAELARRAAGA